MANLHVQPKRKNYVWILIFLIIVIISAAIYYYVNYYNKGIRPATDTSSRFIPSLQLKFAQASLTNHRSVQ